MKQKCSFILKASTALLLALLMLFGTVATSLAAVVDDAETGAQAEDIAITGAQVDLAETGANFVVGSTIYFEISNGPDYWDDAGADENQCIRLGTESTYHAMTKVRSGLLSYTVPSGTNTSTAKFSRGTTSQHWNEITATAYSGGDNNTFWLNSSASGGWGLCPVVVEDKTYIYVDNTNGFLNSSPKFFVVGHDDGSGFYRKIELTQISGTNLYYCEEPHTWGDARYVGLFSGSGWSAGDASKLWSDITTYADGNKSRYSGSYEFKAGNSTLLTTASGSTGAAITPSYLGTGTDANRYGPLNYTQTINIQKTTDNGSTGTNTTIGATVTATAKKLNGLNTTTNSSMSISSSANTNNDKAALTSTVTLTTNDTDEYEFVGWYSGNTCVSTSKTYSYTVSGENTINARFKEKALCVSVITIGNNTVLTKQKTTISVAHKSGFESDGGTLSVTVKNSSNTDVTSTLLSGAAGSYVFNANGNASAGTYTITATCTAGISHSETITVTSPGNIYFKHSTTSGNVNSGSLASPGTATEGQITMTYDAAASAALSGGTASHVVYKATVSSMSKAEHYWLIYDSSRSNNRSSSTAISTNDYRLDGGSGLSTSNSDTAGTIDLRSIGAADTTVYYDVIDGKFYADLPIKVTYQGYCTAQSKNVGTAVTEVEAYGATATSGKTYSTTGYTQVTPVKWYTTNAMSTEYTFPALTGNITDVTIYTPMTAITYTVTLDASTNGGKITKTSGGTAANTATFTHTYGVADTIASQYSSVTPPDGYTFDGWYDSASGGTKYTSVGATDITAAKTYYAHYTEVKAGATVKAFTGTSESATGGQVKVGSGSLGASATISDTSFGITTQSAAVTGTAKTGYHITGWKFNYNGTSNTYYTHLKWSADGSTWNAVANNTTLYNQPGNTTTATQTIYLKTDGTSGITNANTQVQAMFEPNTYTVTLNAGSGTIKKTESSSAAATATFTHTYGTASTISSQYYSVIPPTGYQLDGWYDSASGGTKVTSVAADGITADTTYYARYTEIKASAKVVAYTNGAASSTGGKVQNGTSAAAANFTLTNAFGITTKATISATTPTTGYTFDGWEVTGQTSHVKLYKNADCTQLYNKATDAGTVTTIYVKTDGASGITSSNTEIHALYNPTHYAITTRASYTDGGAFTDVNGTTTATCTGGTITFSGIADYDQTVTITATANTGYAVSKIEMSYDGGTNWETVVTSPTAANATPATSTMTNNTFELKNTSSTTYKFRAEFRKVYYLTAYASWVPVAGDFSKIAAPPTKIEVKSADRTLTYTYAHLTYNQSNPSEGNRGEDDPAISASGTFHEGNKIQILAGNEVKLYYSALGSSEAIRGIFFNNGIRYTLEGEPDRKYTNGSLVTQGTGTDDDWKYTYQADTTLRAIGDLYTSSEKVQNTSGTYYNQSIPTAIRACQSGYTATIDQDTHVVTFNATQNYRNIDIELGSKFRVYFANSDGVVVHSKNLDDYYSIGEDLSGSTEDDYLTIKAEGDADQTNSIDTTNIKVYRADDSGNKTGDELSPCPFTFTYSSDSTAIENSGKTDSTRYIKITGTMPNYNVVIEVNPTVKYNMYLDSKIIADGVEGKTKFNQVASITATKASAAFQSQAYNSSTAGTLQGPNTVTQGSTINYTYAFQSTWSSYYTFVGWYTGTASGPDLDNGYITDKTTLNYTPRKNTYMYAVGTRDLYINGSMWITGADDDWHSEGGTAHNFKMSFDPHLGQNGKYYWTITNSMYSRVSGTGLTMGTTTESGEHYYWSNYSEMGNSYFQFFDEATGNNQGALWKNDDSLGNDFITDLTGKIKYGRIRKATDGDNWKDQMGIIKFKTEDYPGYAPPLTIYYEPGVDAKGTFTVEPSYVYPNIYLSHGYEVGSTTRLATATGTYQSDLQVDNNGTFSITNVSGPKGDGWTPNSEGHVNHWQIQKEDATVRVRKQVYKDDKVTAFFVYDLADNKVYALRDVKSEAVSGDTQYYYADLKMQTGHDLYICPIIEAAGANMTVYFDATQLNSNRWGKIVSCYAWYNNSGGTAQGDFPGQPMIPSDDGTSWVATFPSKKNGNEITGITFDNYVDGTMSNGEITHGHSWLAEPGVMPSVTNHTAGTVDSKTSLLKYKYNDMGTGDDGNTDYRRINCKVQTYDYREPISYFKNNDQVDHADNLTLTFAIKMGNSDDVMSLRHSELKGGNIFSGITHTKSDGSTTETLKFTSKNFQYLTNAKGNQYTDLNGVPLGDGNKPSATYYVIAKGEVIYKNGNLEQVFWSGKNNESKTAMNFYRTHDEITEDGKKATLNTVPTGDGAVNETYTGGVSMDYGVQWYIYDASGNYITNILSAGYADYESLTAGSVDKNSVVGSRLKELGYAVDKKSVAICYDKPRFMYGDDRDGSGDGATKYINSGNNFDSFRATGQWYKNEEYQTATVSVGVGMMTDSGEVLAATNDGGYGNAWARYDTTKGQYSSYAAPTPLGNPYPAVTAAQKDAVNTPIRLDASHDNFQGWYYYDPGTGDFVKASYTDPDNFRPNYSKDIKYYAIYRAAAIYKYKYQGRQGDDYYTVSGGDLQESELVTNLVDSTLDIRKDSGTYSVSSLAPSSSQVSVFKKTLDFTDQDDLNNETPYFLNIGTVTAAWSNFTLTYYYPNSKGGDVAAHSTMAQYNTTVDLAGIASTVTGNAPDGKRFIGWYEYNASTNTYGDLLTKQANYGFVITKNQTIAVKYDTTAPADDTTWRAYIDDNEVTRQMNSSSTGKYYNDTIVRFRKGENAAIHVPRGAEVGVLILNDGGTNGTITTTDDKLTNFANNLDVNGASAKIGSAGKTVTKLCKTITDDDGSPLTYYNRYDFALSSDYAAAKGTKYTVYAYVKIGTDYAWSAVASGTYTV